jgi:ferric-dicitrate binding protein FerR (iron transport regulator)
VVGGSALVVPYLAISGWARARRREREALYRYDVLKRLAERAEDTPAVVRLLEQEALRSEARRRTSLEAAGLTTLAAGAALTLALLFMPVGSGWLLGAVPAAAGAALLVHTHLARKRSPG